MAEFRVHAVGPDNSKKVFLYDNSASTLVDAETGRSVVPVSPRPMPEVLRTSRETPNSKKSPKVLKISLGLSCNYECEYCSQRFVPRAAETNPALVESFVSGLDEWVTEPPERVEFWGGEPLVYIKTLRPLAEAVRAKYPNAEFGLITNGSLLNPEINEWIDRLGFHVGMSHDGPGQHVRGPDPLDDPESRAGVVDLWKRLHPQKRISFNAVLNRHNTSRAAIQEFFTNLTGDPLMPVGEGTLLDAYDSGGLGLSLQPQEDIDFRRSAFKELREGRAGNFNVVVEKIRRFVEAVAGRIPATALGQKCGMDNPNNIAVDLHGNVLTCQNTSIAGVAPNGESHKIGHVSDLANVKLKTSTHWSRREECPKCPVLYLCAGSCMYLEGPLWDASCNNAFADNIVLFAAAIEFLTGHIPVYIEGPQREDRKDIFGQFTQPDDKPKKRVIPIQQVA
jgi:uncharacterized protein